MHHDRVFALEQFFRAGVSEPPRVVISESKESAVVCWHVEPGQRIELHVHPSGQDTWYIVSGEGEYFLDAAENSVPLYPGAIAVAPVGAVHGAVNTGTTPLRFLSVVSPALSGFEPVSPNAAGAA